MASLDYALPTVIYSPGIFLPAQTSTDGSFTTSPVSFMLTGDVAVSATKAIAYADPAKNTLAVVPAKPKPDTPFTLTTMGNAGLQG